MTRKVWSAEFGPKHNYWLLDIPFTFLFALLFMKILLKNPKILRNMRTFLELTDAGTIENDETDRSTGISRTQDLKN